MATKTSALAIKWDGGGGDGKWSTCANWDNSNTCPGSGDSVTFDSTSNTASTIDAGFTNSIASLTIASSYTNTITQASNLTIVGAYSQAAGTFNGDSHTFSTGTSFGITGGTFTASSGTMSIGTTFSLQTGSFTAPSTTLSVINNFTLTSGTFTPSGTVNFTGAGATENCGSVPSFSASFTGQTGSKTVSNCSLNLGASPTIPTSVTLSNSTLTGSGTLTMTAGTLAINASGTITGFTGFTGTSVAVTLGGGTWNMSAYTTANIPGAFNLNSGSFTAPTGTIVFSSTFKIAGGSFTSSSGTVDFSGGAANIDCNGASFGSVNFTGQTAAKTIGVTSTCSFNVGASPTIPNSIVLNNSTLVGTGTLTINGSETFENGTNFLSGFSGFVITGSYAQTATTANTSLDLSTYSPVTIGTNFTLNTPTNPFTNTFTAPTNLMTVPTNFTLNTGTTFTQSTGTLKLTNNGSGVITCAGTYTFNLVQLLPAGSTKTISAGCNLPLGDSPTLGTNTIYVLNGTLSGTGTLTIPAVSTTINTGGAFSGFSTVNLNSTNTFVPGTTDFSTMTGLTSISVGGIFNVANASSNVKLPTTSSFTGAVIFSAGSLTASSGTTTIKGALTISGSTSFTPNGGTIIMAGGNATWACNNLSLGSIIFTGQTGTKTIGSDCNLNVGANPELVNSVNLSGTLSGSGTLLIDAPATLTLNNGSSIASFTGLNDLGTLSVAGATLDLTTFSSVSGTGAYSLSLGTLSMPANGADLTSLTISGGTFNAASGNMTIEGALSITGTPIFNANTGTITFAGGTAVLSCGGMTFYTVVINGTGTKTINSDCTLPLGNNPSVTRIGLYGTLTGSGVLTFTSTVPNAFYPGYQILGFSNQVFASGTASLPSVTKLLTSNQGTYYQANSGATPMAYVGAWVMASYQDKLFLGWSRSVPEFNNDFSFLSYYQNGTFTKLTDIAEQDIPRMKVFGSTLYVPGTDPNQNDWDADDLYSIDANTLAVNKMTYRYSSPHYVDATTTDANGNYSFTGLKRGPYQIKFVRPANYRFSTQAVSGGAFNAIDSKPNTTTGFYSQCNSADDIGIRFDGSSWADNTVDAGLVANSSSADTPTAGSVDSNYYGGDETIGDLVWNDANANGKQDSGELGLAGVRVELYTRDPYFPCGIHMQGFWKDDDGTMFVDYAYIRATDVRSTFTGEDGYFGDLADMVIKSTDNGNTWQIVDDSQYGTTYFSSDITKYKGVYYRNPTLQGGFAGPNFFTNDPIGSNIYSQADRYPYFISYSLDGSQWHTTPKVNNEIAATKTQIFSGFQLVQTFTRNPGYQYSNFVGFLDGVLIPGTLNNKIIKFTKDAMQELETDKAVFGDLLPNYTNSLQITGIPEDITGGGQRYNSMAAVGNYLYYIGSDNKLYISTDIRGWNQVADFSQIDAGAQAIALYYWPEKDWLMVSTASSNGSIYYLKHSDVVASIVNFPSNTSGLTFKDANDESVDLLNVGGTGTIPIRTYKNGTILADFSAHMTRGCQNFSGFAGDLDIVSGRAFMKNVSQSGCNSPVSNLYIPVGSASDTSRLLLCPNVNSIGEINNGCAGSNILLADQTVNVGNQTIHISKQKIGDVWYWDVAGGDNLGGMTYQAGFCDYQAVSDKAPKITSILRLDKTSVRLNFSDVNQTLTNYSLAYGTNKKDLEFLVNDIGGFGTKSFDVHSLKPGTTYYFKIKAVNGCMSGPWSTTTSSISASNTTITTSQIPTENSITSLGAASPTPSASLPAQATTTQVTKSTPSGLPTTNQVVTLSWWQQLLQKVKSLFNH